MKRFVLFANYVLITSTLISCSSSIPKTTQVDELIEQGDKIGGMIVEQGLPTLPDPYLWQFCASMPEEYEPTTSTSDCNVPLLSGIDIVFGWIAKESKFGSNWEVMRWALYIDGHSINLEDFDWYEADYAQHGEDNKDRHWIINLSNLSPGKHTLKLAWTSEDPIDDGFHVYQPGTYQHIVNFTVLEEAEYLEFSSTANLGQHPYTSEKAQLDFLFYLPGDYGKDSQQTWPLIVYLHGAHLRGASLELLMEEPLPRKLEKESDFPFVAVSPLGDGEYEFWAEEKMIDPLFTLLEEIRSEYAIDSKRIYLTGNDMGGNGVWAIGLRHPEYFAALAPIAGYYGYPFEVPENICDLKDVPVWAFHGRRDQFVPFEIEQELVEALVACGGNARITISPNMKNDVPYKVYADPQLYEWFLSQSLE